LVNFVFERQNEDEDEFKSGFESQLAAFDDEVEATRDEHVEIGKLNCLCQFNSNKKIKSNEQYISIFYKGQGPENKSTNAKWSRPALKPIDPSTDTLVFQQIDLDFYEGIDL
jgi:hypothetical protein